VRKHSKRIVVDASVARSAGQSQHPTSSACRDVLDSMLSICHRVVFTQAILDEWAAHQSRYAVQWLAAMKSKRTEGISRLLSRERVPHHHDLGESLRSRGGLHRVAPSRRDTGSPRRLGAP
jgi:hypothetical protein